MVEKVSLDEKLLKRNTAYYKRQLARPTYDFYDNISVVDDNASGVSSPEISVVSKAVENFFASYRSLKETLSTNGYFKDNAVTKANFLEIYSLFGGAAEAMTLINQFDEEPSEIFQGDINFNDSDNFDILAKKYVSVVKKRASNPSHLVSLTKGFFNWIGEEAFKESKKEKYSTLVAQSNNLHIKINDITLNGLSISKGAEETFYSFDHTLKDIVGNRAVIKALKTSIHHVMKYDPTKQQNIMLSEFNGFQQKFTFWGRPGTGKTATLEAMMNYAVEQAKKNNKRLVIKNITNSFKSEYYSKSSNNLREMLNLSSKGDAIYVYIADDIDTVFFSRKSSNDNTQDKTNLEAIMHFLQGVGSVNKGNYLFIATTNHPIEGSGALMERLKECEIIVNGPETKQDYVDLFHIKLKPSIGNGYVAVEEWNRIGELCHKYNLSGRGVANISKRIVSMIYHVDQEPDDISSKSFEEQKSALHNVYLKNKVSSDIFIKLIQDYKSQEKIHIKQEWNSKVQSIANYKLQELEADKLIQQKIRGS